MVDKMSTKTKTIATKTKILTFFLVFGMLYPTNFWVFLDGFNLIRRMIG